MGRRCPPPARPRSGALPRRPAAAIPQPPDRAPPRPDQHGFADEAAASHRARRAPRARSRRPGVGLRDRHRRVDPVDRRGPLAAARRPGRDPRLRGARDGARRAAGRRSRLLLRGRARGRRARRLPSTDGTHTESRPRPRTTQENFDAEATGQAPPATSSISTASGGSRSTPRPRRSAVDRRARRIPRGRRARQLQRPLRRSGDPQPRRSGLVPAHRPGAARLGGGAGRAPRRCGHPRRSGLRERHPRRDPRRRLHAVRGGPHGSGRARHGVPAHDRRRQPADEHHDPAGHGHDRPRRHAEADLRARLLQLRRPRPLGVAVLHPGRPRHRHHRDDGCRRHDGHRRTTSSRRTAPARCGCG